MWCHVAGLVAKYPDGGGSHGYQNIKISNVLQEEALETVNHHSEGSKEGKHPACLISRQTTAYALPYYKSSRREELKNTLNGDYGGACGEAMAC
jgi:hypothetical protein